MNYKFDNIESWLNKEKYLTNIDQKSSEFLELDFNNSNDFLIVTGFTSLDYLIDFIGKNKTSFEKNIKIVLGNEPIYFQQEQKKVYKLKEKDNLDEEVKEYWLNEGISPLQSGGVIKLIELIKAKKVDFRILNNLHAKIYIGKQYAILGSSNFSRSGLKYQFEANIRIDTLTQQLDYNQQKNIAQCYYNEGEDYNERMIVLLNKLLHYVDWQEAVARAVSELIEGKWLENYPDFIRLLNELDPPLWKTQIEAIGQALYILDNSGSLLIADPTGSGKTRLGAVLHSCLINRFWLRGNKFSLKDMNTLLICPPQVVDNWTNEFLRLGSDFSNIISQGSLSVKRDSEHEVDIKIANNKILFIDEAHNYLNKNSNRSGKIEDNTADSIVLYTATPINRKVEDIFRLIEILDIDNLTDEGIAKYEELRGRSRRGERLEKEDENLLREYIRDFIIRRTKKELNKKIDENPQEYRNDKGIMCRYPKQNCQLYKLNESQKDIEIAKEINNLSYQLKGLVRLRKIELKEEELLDNATQLKIFEHRQNSAKALTIYNIQSTLRSSKIALIEHIKGTEYAKIFLKEEFYPISEKFKEDKETGNMIEKLQGYKTSLPKNNLTIELPSWLENLDDYLKCCEEEIKIYEKINSLTENLSNQREERKADFLINLLKNNKLILAFDSRIISLHFIREIIKKKNKTVYPLLVTGSTKAAKKEIKEAFKLGSDKENIIGLCSDSMSEGVNLQQASSVVLLDMPSVMRIAEQRIGRVDRMNSPHEEVEIYFPDDNKEFALKTDAKFFRTAQIVNNVIGGNIDFSEEFDEKLELSKQHYQSAEEIIKLYEEEKEKTEDTYRDGIQDAFQQVKDLIFGENSIVKIQTYEDIKNSKVTLLSKVKLSKVRSSKNFAFFCIRGSDYYAPYWLYVDEETIKSNKKVLKDLPSICQKLRDNLIESENIPQDKFIDNEEKLKKKFIDIILSNQINNLPNKKRRAINLLNNLIITYLKPKQTSLFDNKILDEERIKNLVKLKNIINLNDLEEHSIDYYQLAQSWLKIINPKIKEFKMNNKGVHHLNSNKFVASLEMNPIQTKYFIQLLDSVVVNKPLDKRIASCVIGINIKVSQK